MERFTFSRHMPRSGYGYGYGNGDGDDLTQPETQDPKFLLVRVYYLPMRHRPWQARGGQEAGRRLKKRGNLTLLANVGSHGEIPMAGNLLV